MDASVRVNGEATDVPVSAPASAPPSAQHTAQDVRDVSSSAQQGDLPSEVVGAGPEAEKLEEEKNEAETAKAEEQRPSSAAEEQPEPPQGNQEADALQEEEQVEEQEAPSQPEEKAPKDEAPLPSPAPPSRKEEQTPPKPPRHPESVPTFSGSAISSLIGGRNRVVTTTIVTELTQTRVEPLQPDGQTNGQVTSSTADLFFFIVSWKKLYRWRLNTVFERCAVLFFVARQRS